MVKSYRLTVSGIKNGIETSISEFHTNPKAASMRASTLAKDFVYPVISLEPVKIENETKEPPSLAAEAYNKIK